MPPTLPLSRQDCCRLFLKTLCCTSILFSNISDHWNLISTLWTNIMWHRLEWLAHPLQAGALLHHQLSAAAEGVSGFIAVRGKTRIHCFFIFFNSLIFLDTKLGSWLDCRKCETGSWHRGDIAVVSWWNQFLQSPVRLRHWTCCASINVAYF